MTEPDLLVALAPVLDALRALGVRHFVSGSIEDTGLAKLEWFRRGGDVSERQWTDVVGLLQVGHTLDAVYLDAGARELGVDDLLRRAIDEARSTRRPD